MSNQVTRYQRELLDAFRRAATGEPHRGSGYIGTHKLLYPMSTPVARQVVRDWLAAHPDLTAAQYAALLDSLARGESSNEIGAIGDFLLLRPDLRRSLDPSCVDRWLETAEGWGEVDSICQSKFRPDDLLANWMAWRKLLTSLSKSKQIQKRRASLVLLTRPVHDSDDARLSRMAFILLARLQSERDILITKAVSWLLRALVKRHRAEVEDYLQRHGGDLPRVAVRETVAVLTTGRKTKRPAGRAK